MRTRFLTTDYFAPDQTLDFLRFPLSPLPPPPKPLSISDLLRCCAGSADNSVSYELPSLPIGDALSKFYSDVLPHTIDVCYDDFSSNSGSSYGDVQIPKKESDSCYEEMEAHRCVASNSESLRQFAKDAIGDTNDTKAAIIQFETPELFQYVDNVCMSEKEEIQLLSEVQDCDDDLVNRLALPTNFWIYLPRERMKYHRKFGCTVNLSIHEFLNLVNRDPFDFDVKDHVESVETICLEYDMVPKLQTPDEVDLLPNTNHHLGTTLPLLEVEEIGPADFPCFCPESLFATIEEQHSVCSVDLERSCQDLLVSVEIDILEHISDSHSSKLPLELCYTSPSMTSDIDLIQVIEIPYTEKNTDAGASSFVDTFLFEEFKMLDSDSFDIFETHAIFQTTEETELCNMFPEDLPLRSFEELIVSRELAIIDGTFTSLSVPDLVDDEKIWSLHFIFDKILTELEPVPLSTSDEIYLDWHLLGRGECNSYVNAAIEKVFDDIDCYTMDPNLKSDDGNMLVLEFLFSDGPSDGLHMMENKVMMPSGVSCTEKHLFNEVVSREFLDEDCQIIENIGNLTNADFEKFSSGKLYNVDCEIVENAGVCNVDLHKLDSVAGSMPQFNDLDFFLNPRNAMGGMRTGNKVKPLDAKSILSDRGLQKKETAPSSNNQMQQFNVCEGVIGTSNDRDTILDALLNCGPIKEKCNKVFTEASGGTNSSGFPIPVCHTAQESEPVLPCGITFQDMPIIINTQDFEKEMIISRRSTYQKILTMEKRGVQVVERDLILPVDIVLNSTVCLGWYNCKNIGKKATAQDEGASSVPLCIENIATNILTSLSFAFTTCVLIFEGDCNFIGPVMESADELYAAAASLGIYLQIFYSSSIELTDEIILTYIRHSRDIYKGSLSRLPESETLAESFLTKLPPINPLSAHAIISSGCTLLEFLELTVESRALLLRKNHVPDESVNLLSALCKYGEREESGLTDCSSSLSSPPDSGRFVSKSNSDDRKRKFNATSGDAMYDFRCYEPSKKYDDAESSDQGMMLRPSDSKAPKSPRICLQKKLPDFLLDSELFREGEVPYTAINMDPSKAWPETNINCEPKLPRMDDGFARSSLHVNDRFPCQQKSGKTIKNNREESSRDLLQDLQEDFVGEVVDFYDKSIFDGDFQIDEEVVKCSPIVSDNVKDRAPTYNRTARRLSFDNSSDWNIPMADGMDARCMLEENRQLRADNSFNDVEYTWSNNIYKAPEQQEPTVRNIPEKSMQNFSGQFLKGKNVPPYGESPLSKAVHSGKLAQGSPWTIEFLNRIKEKRRLNQQCQPYASVPRTSYHGNITKATKRRSPSILEYYKYQSDSTSRKVAEQKMQKQHAQLRNERSQGFRPICTPIDKRARRSLSFTTTGTGSQTKLVWGDNISCSQGNMFSS
ncbi:hypothetical protein SOVF_019670 isoform C [Spinacia oleracea]|nr:hypothetical protein SOVF_019670 isoform C [Spinacia oleracea]